MKNLTITVYGRVQGVGFRQAVRQQARYLGLKGFVKNCSDGSVVIDVEGMDDVLALFVPWCRKGSNFSIVESIQVETNEVKGYSGFEIKY